MFNAIPIFRKVDAVFFDSETKEVFRSPVLGIRWDEKGQFEFFDSDIDGTMGVPDESTSNFIGYEFDGKQQNWTESIERKIKRGKQHI